MRRPSDVGAQLALLCGTLMLKVLPGMVFTPFTTRAEEFPNEIE
jgi:hypothetical protein